LMLLTGDRFRQVFWIAFFPGLLSVATLFLLVREPASRRGKSLKLPFDRRSLVRLGRPCWIVILIGAVFTLARFSEAFLLLRAEGLGLRAGLVPVVLVVMNVAYSLTSYPAGLFSDRLGRRGLMALGLAALIGSDLLLAAANTLWLTLAGTALWGVHMGLTQGLLSAMIADSAPEGTRATAFGIFGLVGGVALFAASLLAGWLWQHHGAPAAFWGGAVIAGFALTGFLVFRPSKFR